MSVLIKQINVCWMKLGYDATISFLLAASKHSISFSIPVDIKDWVLVFFTTYTAFSPQIYAVFCSFNESEWCMTIAGL